MKILLTTLSSIALGAAGVLPSVANIDATNTIAKRRFGELYIESPIKGVFLEGSGRYRNEEIFGVWKYVTLNLGRNIHPSKFVGVESRYNDSYSDHTVPARNFYNKSYRGGMHTSGQFPRVAFQPGQVTPDWQWWNVRAIAQPNFTSRTTPGGYDNTVVTGIKYLWHFNANGDLLVDVVSHIMFDIFDKVSENFASVHLGSWFTFHYQR